MIATKIRGLKLWYEVRKGDLGSIVDRGAAIPWTGMPTLEVA